MVCSSCGGNGGTGMCESCLANQDLIRGPVKLFVLGVWSPTGTLRMPFFLSFFH